MPSGCRGCRTRPRSASQLLMEEFYDEIEAVAPEGRVEARPFIPHKSMSRVELQPLEIRADFLQPRTDNVTPFQRHVRILPSPNHQELALHIAGAQQRIIVHPFSQSALLHIGCV